MDSQQSGNGCWTALDSGSPKWAPVDLKTFSKSKTFSLTGTCSHPDIKSAQDGRPFSTDVALFGVSAAKLLALRSPKPSEQDEDFVLSNFIDIQDWTTLYLQEKVASLSSGRALPFDPKVPFVLLQILDNVYDVAMSLVDFFVEAAVKNAKRREDGEIEVEDFACVDFA
ncbi:hypothetical protein GALMADRAFT_446169 [Galerina marginata CBS 339.88]|uniref:Uncharacterized protein n=1 Tax=Galerina marginata (strain CBS 339.88) TaxID=685588 RepID=A0A067T9A4_GALM3|nr:hypothetical protein GALMADRAFT_446169 [Galerina marginata CBS 339.88]